jgi:hypothetical protein
MLSASRRYLLILGLLLAGVAFAWSQHWFLASKPPPAAKPQATVPAGSATPLAGQQDAPGLPFTYFVDVEGWYRITPYETVVRSAYNLVADTNTALTANLPRSVGGWVQAGDDVYVNDDPSVVEYLGHPTIALSRTYQDSAGHYLTLSLLGNSGEDSYLLFSHTPETCLPGRLWRIAESRRESIPIDDRSLSVQYLLTEHPGTSQRQIALYWYLWDTPERDSRAGVLSMRVYLFLSPGESEEDILARAGDFLRQLFPSTIAWDRF